MYAVIENGGKQYRVTPGETVQLETVVGDVGSSLRVSVTAHNMSGSTATASSDQTAIVASAGGTTTVTTPGNKAPTLSLCPARWRPPNWREYRRRGR